RVRLQGARSPSSHPQQFWQVETFEESEVLRPSGIGQSEGRLTFRFCRAVRGAKRRAERVGQAPAVRQHEFFSLSVRTGNFPVARKSSSAADGGSCATIQRARCASFVST